MPSDNESWLAVQRAHRLGPVEIDAEGGYFELVGNSIAAELVSVLRERYLCVAVGDVYNHRGLAAVADHLDGRVASAPWTASRP